MRIERKGNIPPLTPRIVRYLREGLHARDLDEVQSPEQRRADYVCLKDILVIELKTLEEDGTERIENVNDELRKRDDYPVFYGKVPVESLLKNLSDPEEVRRKLADRIGRAIVSHLRKANKQLAAHAEQFRRKNLVRLVVLVNEDHPLYEPDIVMYIIQRELRKKSGDGFVYENIDGVLFMTERHGTVIGQNVTFPLAVVLGHGVEINPWKEEFIERFTKGWADWNGRPFHNEAAGARTFEAFDHVPGQMPRHEAWRLDYRRNPYMKGLTEDQLHDRFDESIAVSTLAFVKNAPVRLAQEKLAENMRLFTHLLEEMNNRAIPVTRFAYSLERTLAAARRLNLPETVSDFFAELDRSRAPNTPGS